ncbi:hypothetical protein EDB19DRAFT_1649989 [Suillus lakei]|nr:hypothetical protein EDB19DRAFT_1649989 [Suillus lakei]
MHTGKWWWNTQLDKQQLGATIIPVIISTDKTQVTVFHNKTAYPVYLIISNIPKEIHGKPSQCAHVLLTYLPTTHLKHITNKASCCHHSKKLVLMASQCIMVMVFHAAVIHSLLVSLVITPSKYLLLQSKPQNALNVISHPTN